MRIAEAFASQHKIRPDFDRGWLEWGTVGDDEWRKSHQVMSQAPKLH